ncbi:MAG: hypothetical protein HY706_09705 [Candidatus Hydrogenedentes bacterium]|nr:hypothetical protein [Candidatus Hydrogenedentota bacterium]
MTTVAMISGCLGAAAAGTDAQAQEGVDYAVFEVSRLRCTIGNNNGLGEHRPWYNGLFNMSSPDQSQTPFVPAYAGFNLENFYDARPRHPDPAVFFEPRANPIEFKRVNATTAELYQAPTPFYGIESRIRFELKEPHYIDVAYTCIPRNADLAGKFFGVFWASYINEPLDKSIHFLAGGSSLEHPKWVQFCTQQHDRDSTVPHESDKTELTFQPGPTCLWNQISPLRYSQPFFYGVFRNMVLIYIFEPNPGLRFAHSPSGGGPTKADDAYNPAWDFQLVVPDYEVDKEYGFRARIVYKPWVNRADVIAEVKKYLGD